MKLVTIPDITKNNGIFIDGDWVETKDQDPNGEVRLIQLADVGDGVFLNKSKRYLTIEKAKQLRCTFLKKGDVLVARMPDPLGRACVFPGLETPCVTVVDVCIVRPDPTYVFPDWLKYLINSSRFRQKINKFITGTTRQRISRGNLSRLSFNLPDIDSQKRVVKILDVADLLRRKRKDSIKLLDEYIKSVFLDMFGDLSNNEKGWKVNIIGNLCEVGSSKRVFVDELVENGVPFYRGTEIGVLSSGNVVNPTLFVTLEHYQALKKHTGVPTVGDLLMPSICPDGRIWLVDNDQPFYFKDGRVLWIHMRGFELNSIYLKYFLKEKFRKDYKSIASGTTFAELKIFALKDLAVLVPPIGLQNKFADIVQSTETLKLKMLEQSIEIDSEYEALTQKFFKGDLDA